MGARVLDLLGVCGYFFGRVMMMMMAMVMMVVKPVENLWKTMEITGVTKNLLPNHKICAIMIVVGHPSKLTERKYYGLPSGH